MNLTATLSALLRAARWHRRPLGMVAAAICVLATVAALTPAPEPTVEVVTCASAVSAGAVFGAADLTLREVPPDVVPDGAIGSVQQLVGRSATVSLPKGSIVTEEALATTSLLAGPDESLASFAVTAGSWSGLLHVGDFVSVVTADGAGGASTVAAHVRIAALPQARPGLDGDSGTIRIVVAAPSPEAKNIAAMGAQHGSLGVVVGW